MGTGVSPWLTDGWRLSLRSSFGGAELLSVDGKRRDC